MTREAPDSSSSFPRWVALVSLAVALWLFFANAVPAVKERAELQTLSRDLDQLRQDYDAAIREVRLGRGAATDQDLQGLLVAIDQMGLTPAELCVLHPEAPAPTGEDRPRTKFP